jgi:hypothetical protein
MLNDYNSRGLHHLRRAVILDEDYWKPRKPVKLRAWMCLGPIVFSLLDEALTLRGQSAEYWSGDYDQVLEWNPLPHWALRQHPLYFVIGGLFWAAIFCMLIAYLPSNMARLLAFVVQFGHTLGAGSWLIRMGPWGWVAAVLLVCLSRIVFDWTWRRAGVIKT